MGFDLSVVADQSHRDTNSVTYTISSYAIHEGLDATNNRAGAGEATRQPADRSLLGGVEKK